MFTLCRNQCLLTRINTVLPVLYPGRNSQPGSACCATGSVQLAVARALA